MAVFLIPGIFRKSLIVNIYESKGKSFICSLVPFLFLDGTDSFWRVSHVCSGTRIFYWYAKWMSSGSF
jgi:hypothetical protein